MNKNVLIVLAGGFLVAILVAVLVQVSLGGKKKESAEIQKIEVLVAAKDLSVGREVREGDLEWQSWPEDSVFAGAIIRDGEQEVADVAQGKLLRPLVEGQPVHMNVLVADDQGDFLSANVEKGMRAVGIQVRSHVIADRLVRPGDYVDVIVTYRVRVSRSNSQAQSLVNRYASETLLEKVRVLAIDSEDTKAVDEAEDGKKKKKKKSKKAIVTLEVTPEGAEKLLLGTEMGDVGLALRSIGDTDTPENDRVTTDVSATQVLTGLSQMSGVASGVRVYSGDRMEQVRARSAVDDMSAQSSVAFEVEENYPDYEDAMGPITLDPSALLEFLEE